MWLLTLFLLAGPLVGQSGQETKRTDAERLYNEGEQLRKEGTKESLEAALKKFDEALPLYHSLGDRPDEAVTLSNLGSIYSSLGEQLKALDSFGQALTLFRAIGARRTEGTTLNNIGLAYDLLGEKEKALGYYNESLLIFRAVGDRGGEATTLGNIGGIFDALGEKQKALDHYAQALPLFRAVEDRRTEAITLNNIGMVYDSLGEKQKALNYYEQALALSQSAGATRATTLSNIGALYDSLGEKQKALNYYGQALPLYRAVGSRNGEANTLNNIGMVYDSLGEKQKALDHYAQALLILRATGARGAEATTLGNIGAVYNSLGEKQKVLDYFGQALQLYRAVGDRSGESTALSNIGVLYDSLGERQKALDYFAQALLLSRAVGDRSGEATTLSNIGFAYAALGANQKALDNFMLALQLQRAVGNRAGEAVTLNNIGAIHGLSGEQQKALDNYALSLPLFRVVGDRHGEAATLTNIGAVNYALGEKQKALEYYAQALSLCRAVGDRSGEANALGHIGVVHNALGERQKALDYFGQALLLSQAVSDRSNEARQLYWIAVINRDEGKLTEARGRIEASLDIIESLRTKITNRDLRSSYFAAVQRYYEFYIDVLMQMHKQMASAGHDGDALRVSERARARALLETLAEANANIRQGVDPGLVERERTLQQRLNARAQEQMKMLQAPQTEEQAKPLAREIEALTAELQQVETEIRQTSPRYAALTQPQPLTLKEIQTDVLDDETLLLEYSLGEERSYLWAVTSQSITSYELPKRSEIEDVARESYGLLTDPERWSALESRRSGKKQPKSKSKSEPASTPSSSDAATRLSQMVLGPVASQLGNRRLVIVADGALQYIPFGALRSPASKTAQYHALIIDHEIISLPSAATLSLLRHEVKDRKPADKMLAVLADPVFESNDERLKQVMENPGAERSGAIPRAAQRGIGLNQAATDAGLTGVELSIPRLPGTRQEANQIIALVPAPESKQALDFSASRQTATSPELSQYRYVHFATHGFLDSVHPELSGIVLSMVDEKGNAQDGFLRAHEVFNLKLPAELVVLSACQTGLGKEVRGEGLVGVTRGFMYAGAPRVVVSLWSVDDRSTAELMTRFYRGMFRDKLRPAAALRAAQVSLMKEKNWQSPYYWAAFTLQGEWR